MISLTSRRALELIRGSAPKRPAYLSAASGLVELGDYFYVVADDENQLGVFSRSENIPGILWPIFHGDLPLEHEERKAQKADLETLVFIPPDERFVQGALLALGSGSKKKRYRGAIISLASDGSPTENKLIDLHPLYDQLEALIGKLNIEGACIAGRDIIFFQRGNKKNRVNASLRISLQAFYQIILDNKTLAIKPAITHYDLGSIDNVPLCFTDAAALPNGDIIFTAAAENTGDSYMDGKCMGSAIGIIGAQGELRHIDQVNLSVKIEGVSVTIANGSLELLLVTDADDITQPAQIYSATLA